MNAQHRRSFTYYNAGALPGDTGGDVYMFTCWNAEHTGCGCFSCYGDTLAANLAALERDSVNRTARKERWDHAKRQWVAL